MPNSGVFVTLYDTDTLSLYLSRGVYGTLMHPAEDLRRSMHFHTLGDYACTRGETHVFFFLKRYIVYGGQVVGPKNQGAFFLNGTTSPMGEKQRAPLVWDESKRTPRYSPCAEPGVFQVGDKGRYSQPYLILFEDSSGLKGRAIASDQLYFRLGRYPYPLPTNSIQDMSFCTMTPGEVSVALELLKRDCKKQYPVESKESVELDGHPMPFKPDYGIGSVCEAYRKSELLNEAHLEASVLSNPELLPKSMRPGTATVCRQVPISPFKPYQMDRADICYYSDPLIRDGTLPSKVIELKNKPAGTREIEQVTRYFDWLQLVGENAVKDTELILYAPSFRRTARLGQEYRDNIHLVSFDSSSHEQEQL
ncbi:MAG: hypothetical protein HXY34_09885 [Candidatus Thorarchaeota archaeon]|nr:hypothetical protein [Candidatus Thorarchaeota archaeon]